MNGLSEDFVPIAFGEVFPKLAHGGEMQPAVGQHVEKHGMLSYGSRRRDPQVRFGLGQVQHVETVLKHRRKGFASKQATRIDLSDVCDQLRFRTTRTLDER